MFKHIPVMAEEVVKFLNPKPEGIYIDATIGGGGHTAAILSKEPTANIYGFDIDAAAIEIAKKNLSEFSARVRLYNHSYTKISEILSSENIKGVSGIIADFGLSSMQIEDTLRGFSFQIDAPLDMRMDRSLPLTAAEVINTYPQEKLADIFYNYGGERYARKIAARIIKFRQLKKISSTKELSEIVKSSYPHKHYYKIHPATRTFQALRIYVNNELENIKKFLESVPSLLQKNARIVVISYHSGEDRIVKQNFIEGKNKGYYKIITEKPLTPSQKELTENKRSRSAKLRCAEKLSDA